MHITQEQHQDIEDTVRDIGARMGITINAVIYWSDMAQQGGFEVETSDRQDAISLTLLLAQTPDLQGAVHYNAGSKPTTVFLHHHGDMVALLAGLEEVRDDITITSNPPAQLAEKRRRLLEQDIRENLAELMPYFNMRPYHVGDPILDQRGDPILTTNNQTQKLEPALENRSNPTFVSHVARHGKPAPDNSGIYAHGFLTSAEAMAESLQACGLVTHTRADDGRPYAGIVSIDFRGQDLEQVNIALGKALLEKKFAGMATEAPTSRITPHNATASAAPEPTQRLKP